MHPDAESLTAFAEQLLPAAERDEILAHMATCSRCREVVFLAQKATGEDDLATVPVFADGADASGRRWFANWRWTWVPIAALVGIVSVAVALHFRNAAQPEPQLGAKIASSDALRRAEPARASAG